jgi:integrase
MATKKLTDASIKALKPKKERYEVWETNGKGFGIRVAPSGRKSFIYVFRFQRLARRMTLGTYPSMKLVEAHSAHAKARELLVKGKDPGTELVESRSADRDASTVRGLVHEYLDKWAKPNKRSWKEDERILNKDVVPALGRKKAKDIKRRDIVLLLDKIVERGSFIQANRTLAVIRKMFNFALNRGILDTSPCAAISAPSKENQRERVLSEDEIKAFWNRLDKAKMAEGTRLALKLQLVTGQRKGEVIGAEWDEFDLGEGWWTIPSEKAKNNSSHRVPLSKPAQDLLKEIKEQSNGSKWLFPSPRGDMPMTGPAIDHAVRNNMDSFKIDPFTPHDLRRTCATQIASMGTDRLIVGKILNHVERGVTATYDRHGYDKEKSQALNKWGRKLTSILTSEKAKVVHLNK